MDWTYFHLALNHFPVIGAIFGAIILGWGVFRRNDPVSKVGLCLVVFTAMIAIPVFLTGEPAEETVENLPGVVESLIENHEDFAKFALIAALISGVSALITLVYLSLKKENGLGRGLLFATLILSLITVATMGWTAKLGGVIRHTEIRGTGTTTGPPDTEQKRENTDDH
ncbi:hypothetical protein [Leptolyngbya sp. 7M]|uniref:hypothetical protein n=1 Tax=Leptolyngbya sp. 7M TaxID=2812896 RepID=UPI001B8B96B3|nr:hypothetical protein [Leptolyngbya sp. 7M]QYO67405.1 hypothetical protein JVX88_11770 [Leptolyngbya sp. 7M]